MIGFLFLLVHLFFAVFLFFLMLSFLTGAPFVPSSQTRTRSMVKLAHLKPGMTVYDLGSGDGRILLAAAKKGAKAIGIEINPFLVLWSKIRCRDKNIIIRWNSLWNTDISDAHVVFVYLLPTHMKKLEQKLTNQLRRGTLVVSNSFIFPNWKILRQDKKNHIYVFRVVQ